MKLRIYRARERRGVRRMRLLTRIGEDSYTSTALDKLLHGNDHFAVTYRYLRLPSHLTTVILYMYTKYSILALYSLGGPTPKINYNNGGVRVFTQKLYLLLYSPAVSHNEVCSLFQASPCPIVLPTQKMCSMGVAMYGFWGGRFERVFNPSTQSNCHGPSHLYTSTMSKEREGNIYNQ